MTTIYSASFHVLSIFIQPSPAQSHNLIIYFTLCLVSTVCFSTQILNMSIKEAVVLPGDLTDGRLIQVARRCEVGLRGVYR